MYIEDFRVPLRGGALASTLKTLVELGMGMLKYLRAVCHTFWNSRQVLKDETDTKGWARSLQQEQFSQCSEGGIPLCFGEAKVQD